MTINNAGGIQGLKHLELISDRRSEKGSALCFYPLDFSSTI